ncbi:MAG: hypothetical protein AAB965_02265 [Patescibacteria group bacterium]
MKKETKKMTIEDLATIVAKGFESVDKRFDLMATKSDLEDLAIMTAKGFEDVSSRFDRVEDDVDKLRHHMEKRFEGLELKVSSYASGWSRDFDRLHEWMEELDKRVNKVEDKLVRK